MKTAQINKIISSSFVDGPGNRLVIFFQGCNFNCLNCHNPQTIGACNYCGLCVDNCPTQALNLTQNIFTYAESRCSHCDKCLHNCPESSSPFAKEYTFEQVMQQIDEALPFINGITFSGGEATLQAEFILELMRNLKQSPKYSKLTFFFDTNGNISDKILQNLLQYADYFMVDLKAGSESIHLKLTGKSNILVLQSIKTLFALKKLYEIRIVLIPNYSMLEAEINLMRDFILSLSPNIRIKLIKFRTHGVRKENLFLVEPNNHELNFVKDIFIKSGLKNTILV